MSAPFEKINAERSIRAQLRRRAALLERMTSLENQVFRTFMKQREAARRLLALRGERKDAAEALLTLLRDEEVTDFKTWEARRNANDLLELFGGKDGGR